MQTLEKVSLRTKEAPQQKKLEDKEQEIKQAQDEQDRLLKIVKLSQEEQANKDKLIKELQE